MSAPGLRKLTSALTARQCLPCGIDRLLGPAGIAQLAERLHRKQQVVGLIPTLGSTHVLALVAERLKALDCKSGERKLHVSSNLTECSKLLLGT